MKLLVIGAAGMIGRTLVERLAQEGKVRGRAIDELILFDIVEPVAPSGGSMKVSAMPGDFPEEGMADRLIAGRPDLIFHLAAIVSGEAEADFDKGYRINLSLPCSRTASGGTRRWYKQSFSVRRKVPVLLGSCG